MADYTFSPDGSVKAGGSYVAFFDSDGTIRDRRGGQVLGHVADDGTVRERSGYGQEMGRVEALVHKQGALLLLPG